MVRAETMDEVDTYILSNVFGFQEPFPSDDPPYLTDEKGLLVKVLRLQIDSINRRSTEEYNWHSKAREQEYILVKFQNASFEKTQDPAFASIKERFEEIRTCCFGEPQGLTVDEISQEFHVPPPWSLRDKLWTGDAAIG